MYAGSGVGDSNKSISKLIIVCFCLCCWLSATVVSWFLSVFVCRLLLCYSGSIVSFLKKMKNVFLVHRSHHSLCWQRILYTSTSSSSSQNKTVRLHHRLIWMFILFGVFFRLLLSLVCSWFSLIHSVTSYAISKWRKMISRDPEKCWLRQNEMEEGISRRWRRIEEKGGRGRRVWEKIDELDAMVWMYQMHR